MNTAQERTLIRAAQQGDKQAMHSLLKMHRGFVRGTALRWFHRSRRVLNAKGIQRDDLFQQANLGFLKALQKFDLARGVRLLTYAHYWIQEQLIDLIRDSEEMIQLRAEYANLLMEEPRDETADADEIEERLRFLPTRVRAALRLHYGIGTMTPLLKREVGERFGISPSRAADLVNSALHRLKDRRRQDEKAEEQRAGSKTNRATERCEPRTEE